VVSFESNESGFSLLEMIVSMAILLVVMAMAFTAFGSARKNFSTQSSVLETQQAARISLDELTLNIQQIGYGIDRSQTDNPAAWQRAVVFAGSHAFAFNADIDATIGPIASGTTITFPDGSTYAGEEAAATAAGAETYVYTLDATGDGTITQADRSGAMSGVINPAAETANPLDYGLFRSIYGYNGTDYGGTLVGVTGYLFTNATSADTYPDGTTPDPLFVYTLTEDLNGDGKLDNAECVVLPCPPTVTRAPKTYIWGDTDFDGALSETEKSALRSLRVGSPNWAKNRLATAGAYYQTTLAAAIDVTLGDTYTLKVVSAANFGTGEHIQLGTGSTADRLVVASVNTTATPNTITLQSAPDNSHALGESIVILDQTFLRAIRSVTVVFDAITPQPDVDATTGDAAVGRAGRAGTRGLPYRVQPFERQVDLFNMRTGA
jgi:prepilin-type N-terminal cleavage/methylation domain-containing protein